MQYVDAIKWLKENDVKKDDGTYYEFGEVMTERTRAHTRTHTSSEMQKCSMH